MPFRLRAIHSVRRKDAIVNTTSKQSLTACRHVPANQRIPKPFVRPNTAKWFPINVAVVFDCKTRSNWLADQLARTKFSALERLSLRLCLPIYYDLIIYIYIYPQNWSVDGCRHGNNWKPRHGYSLWMRAPRWLVFFPHSAHTHLAMN